MGVFVLQDQGLQFSIMEGSEHEHVPSVIVDEEDQEVARRGLDTEFQQVKLHIVRLGYHVDGWKLLTDACN